MGDDVGRGGVFFWKESGFVDDKVLSHNYTILISFKRVVPVEGNSAASFFWSFSVFPSSVLSTAFSFPAAPLCRAVLMPA